MSALPQAANGLLAALQGMSQYGITSGVSHWAHVTERFTQLLDNITLTEAQITDGVVKSCGVVTCLNQRYWSSSSPSENRMYIGSWGKYTATRPPRDVDLYFVLPWQVHARFQQYMGNKQSALLQEVRSTLRQKYTRSDIRGDGPVVLVEFESYSVEVVPAFSFGDGSYLVCDTKNGGRYKTTMPEAELENVKLADRLHNSNARKLVKIMKTWQANCSVPIKSFHLELLIIDFLDQSPWHDKSEFYFDWLCRDFFKYMISRANLWVFIPGTNEMMALGDAWKSRAESAYSRAVKACDAEHDSLNGEAGGWWQMIFGSYIPRIA